MQPSQPFNEGAAGSWGSSREGGFVQGRENQAAECAGGTGEGRPMALSPQSPLAWPRAHGASTLQAACPKRLCGRRAAGWWTPGSHRKRVQRSALGGLLSGIRAQPLQAPAAEPWGGLTETKHPIGCSGLADLGPPDARLPCPPFVAGWQDGRWVLSGEKPFEARLAFLTPFHLPGCLSSAGAPEEPQLSESPIKKRNH